MPLSVPNNSGDNLTTVFRHIEEYLYAIAQAGGGGGSLPDQTGESGNFLTTNGTVASWAPVVAGPALPVWTYTAGVIGSGLLKTNNAEISATSQITISTTDKSGSSTWGSVLNALPIGTYLIFTNSDGATALFQVESPTIIGDSVQFTTTPNAGSGPWSGDYQVSFLYAIQLTLDALYALNDPPISGTTGEFSPITSITVVNGIVTSVSS